MILLVDQVNRLFRLLVDLNILIFAVSSFENLLLLGLLGRHWRCRIPYTRKRLSGLGEACPDNH